MLKEYQEMLRCPDDGANVTLEENRLECSRCGRHFNVFKSNFIEMLPSRFLEWGFSKNEKQTVSVEKSYKEIFDREFGWYEKPIGWGDFPAANPGYRAFVKAELERIREIIGPSDGKIAVDVSAGVGNYSIPLSSSVGAMFHCELDVESIQIANSSAEGKNIFFIRAPYLKLPFCSDVFDYVICTDTLIRGWNHEKMLLTEIYRVLRAGGRAIVDFHNQRLVYKEGNISLYNRKKIASLLMEVDIKKYEVYPFGYIPSMFVPDESYYHILNRLSSSILSCQRYIVVITKTKGVE